MYRSQTEMAAYQHTGNSSEDSSISICRCDPERWNDKNYVCGRRFVKGSRANLRKARDVEDARLFVSGRFLNAGS